MIMYRALLLLSITINTTAFTMEGPLPPPSPMATQTNTEDLSEISGLLFDTYDPEIIRDILSGLLKTSLEVLKQQFTELGREDIVTQIEQFLNPKYPTATLRSHGSNEWQVHDIDRTSEFHNGDHEPKLHPDLVKLQSLLESDNFPGVYKLLETIPTEILAGFNLYPIYEGHQDRGNARAEIEGHIRNPEKHAGETKYFEQCVREFEQRVSALDTIMQILARRHPHYEKTFALFQDCERAAQDNDYELVADLFTIDLVGRNVKFLQALRSKVNPELNTTLFLVIDRQLKSLSAGSSFVIL